jgi:hypothetical protein
MIVANKHTWLYKSLGSEKGVFFDSTSKDKDGITPIQMALKGGKNELAQKLIKDLAEEIDYYQPYLKSVEHPLVLAIQNNNLEIARFILKQIKKQLVKNPDRKYLSLYDSEHNSLVHLLFVAFTDSNTELCVEILN